MNAPIQVINWSDIDRQSKPDDEDEQYIVIGISLKKRFFSVATAAEIEPSPTFDDLITESVDELGKISGAALRESYEQLVFPSSDDSGDLALIFLRKLSERFRNAICAELWEARSHSASGRDLVIALVPTIVAILSLPPTYAALAIPISIVLARAGLRSYCKGYEHQETSRSMLESRLQTHRLALTFLEAEKARLPREKLPKELRALIEKEQKKIRGIERKLNSLNK